VRIEVAEALYRQPEERLMTAIIASGAIDEVGRVFQYQGAPGYHGTSHMRMLLGKSMF